MKKIVAILLAMMVSSTVCFADTVLFPDEGNTLSDCFTDAQASETSYVKLSEDKEAVLAYADKSSRSVGVLNLPEAYSSDGICFEFSAKANTLLHKRVKLFFRDSEGANIFDLAFNMNTQGTGATFMQSAASGNAINASYYVGVGDESRIRITFNFKENKALLNVAKKNGSIWSWSGDYEKSFAGGIDFKSLAISNEWSTADAAFYDFSVTAPEVFENAIYNRVYKEDFTDSADCFTESVSDGRYVKHDIANGNIHVYNGIASGSNTGKITFDNTLTENGVKIAFTYNAGEGHARMKMHFMNSNGEKMHSNNISTRAATDKNPAYTTIMENAAMISPLLYMDAPGVPVRVEMSFNFTDKTVTYRTGTVGVNGYNMGAVAITKSYYDGAAANAFDIKEIRLVNEYTACDITIDDVEVYVPKLSFVKSEANPEEYAVSYTIKNNTDEAITGDIICAVYDDSGSLTEVKILPDATIETTLTDAFMFDVAEDFTKYAIYVWSDISDMIPVSLGYSSF